MIDLLWLELLDFGVIVSWYYLPIACDEDHRLVNIEPFVFTYGIEINIGRLSIGFVTPFSRRNIG